LSFTSFPTFAQQALIGIPIGVYFYWDPETWQKERKEMMVRYADLEEKTSPTFAGQQQQQGQGQAIGMQGQNAMQTQGMGQMGIGMGIGAQRFAQVGVAAM
jgi:hypothetical protein